MQINPKATYKIGKLRSDSRASDPDPVLLQARTLPGMTLTSMGIMDWQQFFAANPLGYKNNTTLDVFQSTARGELKHVYSGTVLQGFGQFDNAMNYGNGYNPTPIGMGNGLGNAMPGAGFQGRGNYSDQMGAVFSHAEAQMQNMQNRHEAEIERLNLINSDLRADVMRLIGDNAKLHTDVQAECEARIKAETELDKVHNDYKLKDQYRKQAEEDAVKLAKEHLDTSKKTSNALNDGSLEGIASLLGKGTEFLKMLNGEPTQNQMQTSIPTSGMNDHAKAAPGQPEFHKPKAMPISPSQQTDGSAPQAPAGQQYGTVSYR